MKAVKKGGKLYFHVKKGALHDDLGVPQGKKIPASKLSIKKTDTPLEKKRKQFALNAKKFHHEPDGDEGKNPKKPSDQDADNT